VLPKKQRVIVEGVQMIKRHMRKSQEHPQGAIVEREGTIHHSNVMKAELFDARVAKRGGAAVPAQT
jgi:large subunit ribosomal protein L24